MTTQPATIDIDELTEELHQSRQTQSWAPHSTRSRWVPELEELVAAVEDGDPAAIASAVAAADAEAVRLATIVAHRKAAADVIADRVDYCGEDVTIADRDDVAGMVAELRAAGVRIDDATNGERDGLVITDTEATAYASCRSFRGSEAEGRWVEIDLLTGEVTVG